MFLSHARAREIIILNIFIYTFPNYIERAHTHSVTSIALQYFVHGLFFTINFGFIPLSMCTSSVCVCRLRTFVYFKDKSNAQDVSVYAMVFFHCSILFYSPMSFLLHSLSLVFIFHVSSVIHSVNRAKSRNEDYIFLLAD